MMQLSIASGAFAKVMKIARKMMPGKSDIPAYNYVQLFQKDGDFFLRAQNSENVVDFRVPFELRGGNFEEVGLPISRFSDILSVLPEQCIDLTFNEKDLGILIRYENGEYNLTYQTTESYPVPVPLGESASMVLPTGVICGAMKTAMAHAAEDTLRPVMNTVAVDIREGKYAIVASDGHTLFLDEYLGGMSGNKTMTALVSKGSIALLDLAVAYSDDDTVTLRTDEHRVRVEGTDFVLQSRLVDGKYPNYNSVIPRDTRCRLSLEKKALLAGLRRVSLMGNAQSRLVRFSFHDGDLLIDSRDLDFSTSASERLHPVQCDQMEEGFEIGFKCDLLISCLNSLDSEEVEFSMIDGSRAAILREVDGKKDKLVLITPMMLQE